METAIMNYPNVLYVKRMQGTENPEDGFWFTCDFPTPGASRYQLTPAHAEESENEMNEEQIDINAAKDVYVLTDSNGIYEFRVMDKDEFETAQQQANFASDGNIYWEL